MIRGTTRARCLAAALTASMLVLDRAAGAGTIAFPLCATGQSVTYAFTGAITTFTVPPNVTEMTLIARGAEGGASGAHSGGRGAIIEGTFSVTPGDVLQILVGGRGDDRAEGLGGAGGGGGSFIAVGATPATATALLVAGGGGGAGRGDGANGGGGGNAGSALAPSGTAGGRGGGDGGQGGAGDAVPGAGEAGGTGGTGGNGGASAAECGAGGGGGFSSDGGDGVEGAGGGAFVNGGPGGGGDPINGGFGGGGGPSNCGGGGGGYNGGGAGGNGDNGNGTQGAGGGGGSLNGGTLPSNLADVNTGNGEVQICHANVATPNDECGNAIAILALPFIDERDVDTATANVTDPVPSCTAQVAPASVWYRLVAEHDGPIAVSTFGSNYDTVLTVLTGSCGALTQATCGDDFAASAVSRVVFDATAGHVYFILVSGPVGAPQARLHLSADELPTGKAAKAVVGCQSTIKKTAATVIGQGLASAGKCVNGLLKCVQNGGDPICTQKACTACGGLLAKRVTQAQKLRDKTIGKCSGENVPFRRLLDGAAGLGFEIVSDHCVDAINAPVTDVNAVADCVEDGNFCSGAAMFGVAAPRARELISSCGNLPPDLECLRTNPTGGAVAADQVKGVLKCGGGVEKAAAKFASTKVKALEKCVDRVFACLDTKPPGSECAAAAEPKCAKDVAVVDKARLKLRAAVDRACGAVSLAVLRTADALNLDAAAVDCNAVGITINSLSDYEECLVRQHGCQAESLLTIDVPLAQQLLRSVNITLFGFCS